VVERSGHFFLAFLAATLMVLSAAITFVFGIGRIQQVKFNRK
jgi:hypothetical protein